MPIISPCHFPKVSTPGDLSQPIFLVDRRPWFFGTCEMRSGERNWRWKRRKRSEKEKTQKEGELTVYSLYTCVVGFFQENFLCISCLGEIICRTLYIDIEWYRTTGWETMLFARRRRRKRNEAAKEQVAIPNPLPKWRKRRKRTSHEVAAREKTKKKRIKRDSAQW